MMLEAPDIWRPAQDGLRWALRMHGFDDNAREGIPPAS